MKYVETGMDLRLVGDIGNCTNIRIIAKLLIFYYLLRYLPSPKEIYECEFVKLWGIQD